MEIQFVNQDELCFDPIRMQRLMKFTRNYESIEFSLPIKYDNDEITQWDILKLIVDKNQNAKKNYQMQIQVIYGIQPCTIFKKITSNEDRLIVIQVYDPEQKIIQRIDSQISGGWNELKKQWKKCNTEEEAKSYLHKKIGISIGLSTVLYETFEFDPYENENDYLL